jgi:uncharacterized protein (DUF433 family)
VRARGHGEVNRMAEVQALVDRIVVDREIMAGKPVVKGTRIPVELVLEYLARNPNFDELFADYPRLEMADVRACLAYAEVLVKRENGQPPAGRRAPA